jgi:hypothetical protein
MLFHHVLDPFRSEQSAISLKSVDALGFVRSPAVGPLESEKEGVGILATGIPPFSTIGIGVVALFVELSNIIQVSICSSRVIVCGFIIRGSVKMDI